MRKCEQDVLDRERLAARECQERLHLVAGIDEHGVVRPLASDDVAVLEERSHGSGLDYHQPMILAVLDDLMFTSKIKTAASQLGVPVAFARSSAAALDGMRKETPALVIFDLNNPRTDPLGTLAAMKAEGALANIPTLGFVSHVQVDLIAQARQAGMTEVLPRSAFSAGIGEILTKYR
jgi:CheY-like chemotaxis protein